MPFFYTKDKMSTSLNSTMEDITSSDSGVHLLDSELSELMAESITSQTGSDFEEITKSAVIEGDMRKTHSFHKEHPVVGASRETQSVDTNSNVDICKSTIDSIETAGIEVKDAMTDSTISTFDTSENIVYRRKVRKSQMAPKAPKKRVSFHEDILKNTRTDNIHIEHGFITYKNGRRISPQMGSGAAGRYSWCSEGDNGSKREPTELCAGMEKQGEADSEGGVVHRVYRNACSDMLDYSNSELYNINTDKILYHEGSGVFEYSPKDKNGPSANYTNVEGQYLCNCSCSSSNSSLNSDKCDKNSNRQKVLYGQEKSNSCDCIGISNANNNNIIGENCYFSEPNMGNLNESEANRSVWNKEKKPKSSCLKKTKHQTYTVQEQDLTTKVKKFNVHDMNQLLNNSKMIFGSLKSIFTIPLPERGVPEGSEDLQSVRECFADLEPTPEHKLEIKSPSFGLESPTYKAKPFLSKSLDGSRQQSAKKYVHNVDEQLRHQNVEDIFEADLQEAKKISISVIKKADTQKTLQRQEEIYGEAAPAAVGTSKQLIQSTEPDLPKRFHNKFIVDCESTVFEHTGVSYCYEGELFDEEPDLKVKGNGSFGFAGPNTPIAQPEPSQLRNSLVALPITKTFSNFFRVIKESAISPTKNKHSTHLTHTGTEEASLAQTKNFVFNKNKNLKAPQLHSMDPAKQQPQKQVLTPFITPTSSSNLSEISGSSGSFPPNKSKGSANNILTKNKDNRINLELLSRHLPSPLKNYSGGENFLQQLQPQRRYPCTLLSSPDRCNANFGATRSCSGRDSKSTILSEDFDDILTVTTDTTDKLENDIVILDYPDVDESQDAHHTDYSQLLKAPQSAAKTSLINRFLRNVTQKKILESSLRTNKFFLNKLKKEQTLLAGQLWVPGVKPQSNDLIDDLNAEIAMEVEMSSANSPRHEMKIIGMPNLSDNMTRFDFDVGEISTDIFNGNYLHILRDETEQLMKVFKLYTGYSHEGYMTPVLVFLTDKTLYVTDLDRNRLCSKFALAYAELDVILIGPNGYTVLLSNCIRDMQQVLLAGGPNLADRLVASLELCARRSGSTLPAVGQLTLEHLAPLQAFVRENSCIGNNETWMFYAVVHIPAGTVGIEKEPLGPNIKGFLMARRVREKTNCQKQSWRPGYFLLKAGVLYMFNDSNQKLPIWATALAECEGARRSLKAGRPHCFEVMLKEGELLQLAAPDEYVASEWLQSLLQAASEHFEMQLMQKTLGCTVVVTENYLITLRENFSTPLTQINKDQVKAENIFAQKNMSSGSMMGFSMNPQSRSDTCSSLNSTPTKLSQTSQSTAAGHPSQCSRNQVKSGLENKVLSQESYSSMSSLYGKNAGLEILGCAAIKEMAGIKIPSQNDMWWCILEFSCQEVRAYSDDLVFFFASNAEMQRFLRLLEHFWQAKNNDLFPITILDEDDVIAEQCALLSVDIMRSWDPLLSAVVGCLQ